MDRQKKTQAVELLAEYVQELQVEIEAIQKAIAAMSEAEAPTLIEKQVARTEEPPSIWATMGTHEAVEKLLELHPNKAYRASEIKNQLKERKIQGSDRKAFASNIATTVRRLVERGKAVQTTVHVRNRIKPVAAFQYKSPDS